MDVAGGLHTVLYDVPSKLINMFSNYTTTFFLFLFHFIAGIEWLKVPLPKPGLQMNRISLGTNVVWALSSDRQLWFREGIPVGKVKSNDKCLVGSKWINVPGKMTAISAASDDSVTLINLLNN